MTDYRSLKKGAAFLDALAQEAMRSRDDAPERSMSKPSPDTIQTGDRQVLIQCAAQIPILPIRWLWHEWLPAGKLVILAGTPGTGKTTLSLQIAATITNGGKFPDGSRHLQKDNVLVWSSEDAPNDTLIPRLVAAGADLNRCHFISGFLENGEKRAFDPATDIYELDKAVLQMGGASLLIVDPIVSAVSGDMHRANEVRRSLQALVDFAERHGCAVLGITHFSKGSSGRSPQERVIGSQAFAALARMVWVAAKEEGGNKRVLARAKSNIAPDDGGFGYSLNQTTLNNSIATSYVLWEGAIDGSAREILGDVEHDENGGSALEEAESFLKDLLSYGPITQKQIQIEAIGAGHSKSTLERAKKKLGIKSDKNGLKGGWYWHLPCEENSRRYSIPSEDPQEKILNTLGKSDDLQDKEKEDSEIEVTL